MKFKILGAVALIAALAVGCSKNNTQTASNTPGTDTSAVAQNNPVAGSGPGYPSVSEREREARALPPGTPERRTSTRTSRYHRSSGGRYNPPAENMGDGGGATAPAAAAYATVPAGKIGAANLDTPLSSETSKEGDTFTATLAEDWMENGQVVVPAGTKVLGHLATVESTGRGKTKAELVLAFDRFGLPNGQTVEIAAKPETFKAEGNTKGDIAKIGGGTVIGGVIGAVTGNTKKGAVIGGVVGGAAAMASRGKPVELASGQKLNIELSNDVRVPLRRTRS